MALTPKQQAFVDAYAGNGTEAARAAGYQGTDATLATVASKLLKVAKVSEALARRRVSVEAARAAVVKVAGTIATRAERQAFWTATMLDSGAEMSARLKASELLGRSEVDFTDKVSVDAKVTLGALIEAAGRLTEGEE
jgi:phage terminase small subunit